MRESGSTRSLLVVALAASVAVLTASVWYLATSGVGDDIFGSDSGGADDEGEVSADGTPLGTAPIRKPSQRKRADRAGEDGEGDDPGDDGIIEWGTRTPDGEVYAITPDTLRRVLDGNVWTEVPRHIEDLQRRGIEIPEDIVTKLLELLRTDGRRLDAVTALGFIRDAGTGLKLAELAADASEPEAMRTAALAALARSGQDAGITRVRELVEAADADTPVVRQACFALAAMGGPQASEALLGALGAHGDDDLTDAVLTSLSKLRDGDTALAQALRGARTAEDPKQVDLILRVGTRMGAKTGPELRAEVRSLVESPVALAFLESDPEERDRLRTSAVYVASAMGGEALDAVIALAASGSQEMRQISFNSLRNARGDESAAKIAVLLRPELDTRMRYDIVSALGATGSPKASPAIHAALDDPEGSVREAAAAALSTVRDPKSVPVILDRIDRARGDTLMATLYVKALGQIGLNEALPKLESLLATSDDFWSRGEVRLWVRQAINRIRSGNPETTVVR